MTLIIRKENEVHLRLDRDFAAEYTQDLKAELNVLISEGRSRFILDFSQVRIIDSLGIGLLVGTHNSLLKQNGYLKIVNVSEDIFQLFKNMRLNEFLDVEH